MPFYDLRCPTCQKEQGDVLLKVDEPRACACGTPMEHVWRAKPANVIGERVFIQENGFKTPREFRSYRELERVLDRQGMEIRAQHTTAPGTDKGLTTDWAKGCVDAQMLENARILVSRPAEAKPTATPGAIELVDAAEAAITVTWTKRDWPVDDGA